jgi:hypothetical protein
VARPIRELDDAAKLYRELAKDATQANKFKIARALMQIGLAKLNHKRTIIIHKHDDAPRMYSYLASRHGEYQEGRIRARNWRSPYRIRARQVRSRHVEAILPSGMRRARAQAHYRCDRDRGREIIDLELE